MNYFEYLKAKMAGTHRAAMDSSPRTGSTYRDRYYAKYRFRRPQKPRTPAQDWASGSLAEHDERFHPNGFRPEEGDRCSLRSTLKKMDAEDLHEIGQASDRPIRNGVTAAMDARYSELFEEFEKCEAANDSDGKAAAMKELRELFDRAAHLAFRDSVVKGDDDMPKVVYHGTTHGGFTEFDTDGNDKTKDTGAWFTDVRRTAFTYSGKDRLVKLPRPITGGYLMEEGLLEKKFGVYKADGSINDDYGLFSMDPPDPSAWLDAGERVGEVWVLTDCYGDRSYNASQRAAVVEANKNPSDYLSAEGLKQSCIYTCFLNITDPDTVNAYGESWDSIVREYNVYGPDGEFIDGAYTKEDAEELVEREKAGGVEGDFEIQEIRESSDEIVRGARLSVAGYDGFVISHVSDSGPYGTGYWSDATDYIAFKPGSIKLSDVVTFDDNGAVIPLSRRFDFSNSDIRY